MKIQGLTPLDQRRMCLGTHQMQLQMIENESHVVCILCGYNFPSSRTTPVNHTSSSKVTL